MNIRSLTSRIVEIPFRDGGRGLGITPTTWNTLETVLIRVEDTDGVVGWGEAFGYFLADATRAVVERLLRPLLEGSTVESIEAWNRDIQKKLRLFGRYGVTMFAISGVDMALWDLRAKRARLPLYRLLGEAHATPAPIATYASLVRYGDAEVAPAICGKALDEGFENIKLHEIDLRYVEACHRLVDGRAPLSVDVNCAWDASATRRHIRRLMRSRFRWFVLALLFLAMLINYMDRAALSIAMPFIARTFTLTPSEKGLILSSFFVGHALFDIVGGYLADRLGPKRVFTWAMVGWSFACAMTAAATGFMSPLVIRTAFGVGEDPISATANRTVANWFPTVGRARAVGFNQAGGPLGGALAGPVVGFMAIEFGWRPAFIVVGALGLIWVLAWHRFASDHPRGNPRVSAAECALIEQKHLTLAEMRVVSSFPWLVGALGYILGGVAIDALFRLTGKALLSRKIVLVTCLAAGGLCIAATGRIDAARPAVVTMSIAVGLIVLTSTAYWALIPVIVPGKAVGTAKRSDVRAGQSVGRRGARADRSHHRAHA
ncbi:MAG: MFS transporter [Janthinobacterium lividum]